MSLARAYLLCSFLILLYGTLYAQIGANDHTFNPNDPGNGLGDGANGDIFVTCLQPDGKILIGGGFSTYNGTTRHRLARLNSDGSLDHTFSSPLNGGNHVYSIVMEPDGKIIVGGSFSVGNRQNIVRLNTNGTLDDTFTGSWPWGTIRCMVRQPDSGNIVIGGSFAGNTNPRYRYISRLLSDGTLDTTFNATGSGVNSTVRSMLQQQDGKILIGGDFTTYNGVARSRIARLEQDGSLDLQFESAANGLVLSFAIQGEEDIIVSGDFTTINGSPANRIARLNNMGLLDNAFAPDGANATVTHVSVLSDGKIVLVGSFSAFDGVECNRVAKLNHNGSLDISFQIGSGANSYLYHTSINDDGKIILAGYRYFNDFDGNYIQSICRLNSNGTYDVYFNPGSGFNRGPSGLLIQSDDKIIAYGIFTKVNGQPHYGLVRLEANGEIDTTFNPERIRGRIWSALLGVDGKILIAGNFSMEDGVVRCIARLMPNGDLDVSFDAGDITSEGDVGTVHFLHLLNNGNLLIRGDFDSINGFPQFGWATLDDIGMVDPNGSLPPNVNGMGIVGIIIQPDGKMLIHGSFSSVNGIPRNQIARLHSDGSVDVSFDPGIGPQPTTGPGIHWINDAVLHTDGRITITGDFSSYAGVSRRTVARINSDGSLDLSFEAVPDVLHYSKLLLDHDGKLFSISRYQFPGQIELNGIVRYTEDGSWLPVAPFNSFLNCFATQSDNKIVVGGNFTRYSTYPGRNRIARVMNDFTTGAHAVEDRKSVTLYPNPANGVFAITSMQGGTQEVTVTDSSGQVVWHKRVQCDVGDPCHIDLSEAAPGIYLVKAKSGDMVSTARVVIL